MFVNVEFVNLGQYFGLNLSCTSLAFLLLLVIQRFESNAAAPKFIMKLQDWRLFEFVPKLREMAFRVDQQRLIQDGNIAEMRNISVEGNVKSAKVWISLKRWLFFIYFLIYFVAFSCTWFF